MSKQALAHPALGVAYYPEHWPESRWATDAKLLRDAGITVARMMEFAWDKLEPREGEFHFEWMDRALQIFQEAGIKVILCTPTATPPPWLTKQHPEILRVDDVTGQTAVPGSRRSANANAPAYQAASDHIVTAVAEHFGKHPNVIGWQIDNEFGCHSSVRDISDFSKAAFQTWLREKYGTLDALNTAWGTQFWSATYTAWDEIPVPAPTTAQHNPGLLLDFRRFSSDAWVKFQRSQINILRPHIGPDRFITHNFMIRYFEMDYFELAKDLDFVSYDNYPHGLSGPMETAFNLDLMRGLKGGRGFWIVEQQAGQVNWTPFNPPVPPGQTRLWTHQAFAHGAEVVSYFRERAVNIGQEQFHSGLMKHDGTPDRGWHEAKQVAEDLKKIGTLKRRKALVALMFDYEDLWTLQLDPHNSEFSYYAVALEIYSQLWEAQIPVDIVARGADLSGYSTVFVPSPALIRPEQVAQWRKYVEAGGNLVVTFRGFYKNPGNTWTDEAMPAGGLSELLGVTVDEYLSIPPIPSVGLRRPGDSSADWDDDRGSHIVDLGTKPPAMGFGEGFGVPPKSRYRLWAEVLKLSTATPLLRYVDGYYKDQIGGAVNHVGQGAAYSIGCWGDQIIPRSVWQACGLNKLAMPERDLPRGSTFEVVTLEDEKGGAVELRLNHSKRAISLAGNAL